MSWLNPAIRLAVFVQIVFDDLSTKEEFLTLLPVKNMTMSDPDFPINYQCIIHQQAIYSKVLGFDHVITPVVKIMNSIRAKAQQHRSFKLFLEESSAENENLLLNTEIRRLSRSKMLQRFLSLLSLLSLRNFSPVLRQTPS